MAESWMLTRMLICVKLYQASLPTRLHLTSNDFVHTKVQYMKRRKKTQFLMHFFINSWWFYLTKGFCRLSVFTSMNMYGTHRKYVRYSRQIIFCFNVYSSSIAIDALYKNKEIPHNFYSILYWEDTVVGDFIGSKAW